jgi:hypothetical protein
MAVLREFDNRRVHHRPNDEAEVYEYNIVDTDTGNN